MPAFRKQSKIVLGVLMYSSTNGDPDMMSSMYAAVRWIPASILSMVAWNSAGAKLTPEAKRVYLKYPLRVAITMYFIEDSATGSCK